MSKKNKPYTLKVTVEIEFTPDHDEIAWYCDEVTGEVDIDIVANHMEAHLRPYNLQTYMLQVTAARYDNR